MQIVAHQNGVMTDAGSLAHDGRTYPGPVFDVPPDVGRTLLDRPTAFRLATAEEIAAAQPKPAKPRKS